jgi:hypothetical protein
LSLALLALGTGIGFSAVSPWSTMGASAPTLGWMAIGWLVLMQIITSSVAGYLAGRLRTKWVGVHTHEVFFRDSAHGFLVWAVSLVISAAFLTSASGMFAGAVSNTPSASSGTAQSSAALGTENYVVDTLLRTTSSPVDKDNTAVRTEVGLVLAHGLREGSLPPADRAYLAQVVAARTGANQAEAERRVDEADARMREGAEATRKAISHAMYWTFLALLVGAFVASLAATIGGRERDRVPAM